MALISYLTRTQFADAAIEDALPEEASAVTRALLLTDRGPGTSEALCRVHEALPRVELSLAYAPSSAPERAAADAYCHMLKSGAATTLIAVGGDQAIRQARLVVEQARRLGSKVFLIVVPVGLFDLGLARLVRPADAEPALCPRPDLLIADPTVLMSIPARRLVAAGMETLVHAVEAYANPGCNPAADGLAFEAVRRLARWLPRANDQRLTSEARRELMSAALVMGLSLEKPIGGLDAIAHPLEAVHKAALPGELHAAVFAPVLDFNAQAVGDRYATLADALGTLGGEATLKGRLSALACQIGLPASLREHGVDRSRFPHFARLAADDPAALSNPRRLTPSDCQHILEAAW